MSPTDLLSSAQAKSFYDRFGKKQDWQLYENRALDDLLAHGEFATAHAVFEFGCGTGRLAAQLLRSQLPDDARYHCVDISDTMARLTRERLRPWANRVDVRCGDGTGEFPRQDTRYDRFVCTYVLDLLPEPMIAAVLERAHRLLTPTGLLCTASLTHGRGPMSRTISRLWSRVAAHKPMWVGGCRPIRIRAFAADEEWSVRHYRVLRSFGICSEVLVAEPSAPRAR